MAHSDIKPGKYKGVVLKGQFSQSSEKKTPCIAVLIEFEVSVGKYESLWWTGWLTEATLERTLESLAIMGYDESKKPLEGGVVPKEHFDPAAEFTVVIEPEEYTREDGEVKTFMKIKWINQLGGSRFAQLTPEQVSGMVSGLDLKNKMAEARAKLGLNKKQVKNYAPGAENPNSSGGDVPF